MYTALHLDVLNSLPRFFLNPWMHTGNCMNMRFFDYRMLLPFISKCDIDIWGVACRPDVLITCASVERILETLYHCQFEKIGEERSRCQSKIWLAIFEYKSPTSDLILFFTYFDNWQWMHWFIYCINFWFINETIIHALFCVFEFSREIMGMFVD